MVLRCILVSLTVFMSAAFKSPYTVIIIDFLFIVILSFLYSNMGGYLWQHVLALFPSKIAEFKFDDYITYSVGDMMLDRSAMMVVTYVILYLVFIGISYSKFKNHEVNK